MRMPDQQRKARKLEKKGNVKRAGDIYVSINHIDDAIRCYKQAGLFELVGDLLVDHGRFDEAVDLYQKHGFIQKALDILKQRGDYFRGALICKKHKKFREAASLFEKSGVLSEAARMCAEEQDFKRAGDFFLRSDMPQSAAEAYENAAKQIRQKPGSFTADSDRNFIRVLWKKAAGAWELVPNPGKAAKIYHELMEWEKAGELYELVGSFRKALHCYEQADSIENLIRLTTHLNMEDRARKLLARKAESEGDPKTAAVYALQAEDYAKAAEYFEMAGDYQQAAENYENSQAYLLAAEAYFRIGNVARAAAMYRMAGDLDTSAKLFEQLGQNDQAIKLHVQSRNFSRAAMLLLEANKPNEALRVLSRVSSERASQRLIKRLSAIAHFKLGNIPKALKLAGNILEEPVSSDNIEIQYEYANALQEDGRLKEALVTFQNIIDYDKHYKNALKCLNWCAAMEETVSAKISDTIVGELPIGLVVAGRYELLKLLGKGGMGVVYRAADRELNLAVALKILRPKLSYDPDFIEMFKREVTLARMLSHPNIIKIYDLNRMGNMWFVSMEYLQGEEVKDVIIRDGTLPHERVKHLARQILSALSHSHERNLVHSDIKPQNIFVDAKDHATLVDFGIARTMSTQTTDQNVYGTPGYISPEQISGQSPTQQSDLYSLGVTLYEMLTGNMPFDEKTTELILRKQLRDVPPPPSTIVDSIPEWMDSMITKMVQINLSARYSSADEILSEFPSD
jgi:tetratricopeptide (TPR) repeat protein